jgi:predicted RNase H-like nuclease (RuvC/YqgF family)
METMQASPERSKGLINEKNELRKQIDTLKKEIMQLENNLGFFAKSKGADLLKKEVEQKVAHANAKIETLKQKLKLIPNE